MSEVRACFPSPRWARAASIAANGDTARLRRSAADPYTPGGRPRFLRDDPGHPPAETGSRIGLQTMRAPRCWRQLLAIVLVAIILPAPIYANASSTDAAGLAAVNEAGRWRLVRPTGGQPRNRRFFAGRPISLSQAMAIAEARHAGATTADVSFDGAPNSPVYRVKTLHNDRIWQHAIDATTGEIVGGEAALPLKRGRCRGPQQPRCAQNDPAPPGGCRSRGRAGGVGQGHQRRPDPRTRPAEFRDRRHERRAT